MTKEKTLSNANSVGPESQASLAGMTKKKTSGNNRNGLERKTRLARLAGMTRVGVFAQHQHGGLERKARLAGMAREGD